MSQIGSRQPTRVVSPTTKRPRAHPAGTQATALTALAAPPRPRATASKERYFVEGNPLNERDKAYCRCTLHVGAKNREAPCGPDQWGSGARKKGCYNEFAVCRKSVEGAFVGARAECTPWYNFEEIPTDELVGYAVARRVPIPGLEDPSQIDFSAAMWEKVDRDELLGSIADNYVCTKDKGASGLGLQQRFCDRYAGRTQAGRKGSPGRAVGGANVLPAVPSSASRAGRQAVLPATQRFPSLGGAPQAGATRRPRSEI